MKNVNLIYNCYLSISMMMFGILKNFIQQIKKKSQNYKRFLFVFTTIFVLFQVNSYAEDEPNNSCLQANDILTGGLYSGYEIGSSSSGDRDYYYFDVPLNGELNVTITNTHNNKSLRYSNLILLCPAVTTGTLTHGNSITLTISSTLAGRYYLYVEGGSNNPSTDYRIDARFTPNIPTPGTDLKITKTSNVGTVLIYDPFIYTVNVYNIGETNASNVVVTDTLPSGMNVDINATNTGSPDWGCIQISNTVTCTHTGNLNKGALSTINLHVQAPSTTGNPLGGPGLLTNTAVVSSSAIDINPLNNTAIAITTITNEVDNAKDLCYLDTTDMTLPSNTSQCEIKGNFHYGNGCSASVLVREVNATDILSSIKVYKMYAPDTSSGSCTYSSTSSGLGGGNLSGNCSDITNTTDYGSYTEGYAVDINQALVNNLNIILNDTDTDKNPRIDGIAMFGDYWTLLGFHHKGRIYDCNGTGEGGIEVVSSADVIDTPINNAADAANYVASTDTSNQNNHIKYIQTMITSDNRNIVGVHLDLAGVPTIYLYEGAVNNASIPYSITPYLTDNTCSMQFENILDPATNQQLVIDIPSGAYSAQGTMLVSDTVRKNARIQMIFIDPNTLSVEGQRCLANSSTTGNFARLAQCVNSEVQYKTAFGQDAWDRCGLGNGNPCLSSNHGYSCGVGNTGCPGYNPLYDNELGCYMCTFNIQPACSTDNFAIRPEKFDTGMSHPDAPNLLRAAEEYGASLTALDALNNISTSYTVVDHNFNSDLDINITKYFRDGSQDLNNALHGTSEVNNSTTAYMVQGISSLTTSWPGTAQEIINVSYDDVGLIGLHIYDKNWAAIDNDDTPMDCNSTNHTYICGDKNVTFIPHHFEVAELNITNFGGPDGTFTYIANERNLMSAKIQTHMKAENRDGNITQNFREGLLYYENNVSVIPTVEVPGSGQTNGYFYPDANESNISNQMIGFGRAGFNEENGTRKILWNEPTYPLEYNFQRDRNRPGNPFIVTGSNLYILMVSHYIDPADGDTADINGSRAGDFNTTIYTNCGMDSNCQQLNAEGNATFYYGRARPSQFFYPDVTTESINTPVAINIYCDLGFTQCGGFGINTVDAQISEFDWWLALDHNTSANDGNVTLAKHNPPYEGGSGDWDVNPKLLSIQPDGVNNGIDNSIIVSRGTNPTLPLTVGIDLDTTTDLTTGKWLIYNPDSSVSDPIPFYKVRFVGQSGWAGYGDTGHVVETNSSTKKNKRLGW